VPNPAEDAIVKIQCFFYRIKQHCRRITYTHHRSNSMRMHAVAPDRSAPAMTRSTFFPDHLPIPPARVALRPAALSVVPWTREDRQTLFMERKAR
jgi:hypothetical protein